MTGASTSKEGISIIVPIYNEAKKLPDFIDCLFSALAKPDHQIIFVDGGSQDNSCKIIENTPRCNLIHAKKGRAKQMNAGAKHAKHSLLYFLHVDCIPPHGFDELLYHQIKKGKKAGCFQLKFDHSHFLLDMAAYATKFNSRFCRSGDQSLFVDKVLFKALNGFNEDYPICEDVELIDRLYKAYGFTVLPQKIVTSARRFKENGVLRLHFHHGMIHIMRYLGTPPESLYRYYSRFVK